MNPPKSNPPKGSEDRDLQHMITALLADEQYREHPLREALERLWMQNQEQLARLERIMHVSDGYQSMAREQAGTLAEQFNRQVRQVEKAVRISDRYQRMMREINHTLKEASTRDHLTGLANRRMVMERLKEETTRSTRNHTIYTIAMLDIDHFKQVNDTYGHVAGDQVLVEVGRAIEAVIREYDLCGRWGGEEFLILLPDTGLAEAEPVVGRVLEGIRRLSVPIHETGVTVTVSLGVAEYSGAESFSDTINRADAALLEAKRAGRDRVIIR